VPSGSAETSERTRSPSVRRADPGRDGADSGSRATARTPNGEAIQIVHGAKRVSMATYELQRTAAELIQTMVKPPYAPIEPLDALEGLKLAGGVTYQVLYERSALALPAQLEVTSRLVALGEQARVVHAAPARLMIVDNEVAMLPLTVSAHAVDSAVLIRGSELLATAKRIFDDLWRFAAPFSGNQESRCGDILPSEQDRWILSLLASGATDDAIGRLMGFSARTAHRRVRTLIARLGAETRFQAGMRAVQLGWL
jgi:DNA-binding CsgD family transcriptional regulator